MKCLFFRFAVADWRETPCTNNAEVFNLIEGLVVDDGNNADAAAILITGGENPEAWTSVEVLHGDGTPYTLVLPP